MNISRGFLVIGAVYLLVGMIIGSKMGASGDHSLTPVHAHMNLLGFTLMTLFGLAYRVIPALGAGWMGKAHFWLHQLGSLALLIALYLMYSGSVAEPSLTPVLMLSTMAVMLGGVIWIINIWRATQRA